MVESMAHLFHPNDGNVVYDTVFGGKAKSYWQAVHDTGQGEVAAFSTPMSNSNKEDFMRTIGGRIIAQANAEKIKESALLAAAGLNELGIAITDKDLVDKINILIRGKQEYLATLNRLKAAQAATSKKTKKGKNAKIKSPEISSLFASKFASRFNAKLRPIVLSFNFDEPVTNFRGRVKEAFDMAVDLAVSDIFSKTKKENENSKLYDNNREAYDELLNLYKTNDFNKDFKAMIRNKLNIDALSNQIYAESTEAKRLANKKRGGFSKKYIRNQGLKLNTTGYALNGSVKEFIETLISQANFKVNVSQAGSTVFMNEVQKIDTMSILNFKGNGNFIPEKILQDFNDEMEGSKSLIDASRKMEEFYNKYLAKLDDSFIIYTNDKAYGSVFSGSRGFKGGTFPVEMAPIYMNKGGVSVANDFLYLVYNSMTGAVGSGRQAEVKEAIKSGVTAGVSAMLFDDWNTVGVKASGGAQSIHLLRLSGGFIVPLSTYLRGMGMAMMRAFNSKGYLNVTVQIGGVSPKSSAGTNAAGIQAAWSAQASEVKGKNTFTINFLSNFNQIINSYIH